jgi:flagellar motor switch protein FliN/FliY
MTDETPESEGHFTQEDIDAALSGAGSSDDAAEQAPDQPAGTAPDPGQSVDSEPFGSAADTVDGDGDTDTDPAPAPAGDDAGQPEDGGELSAAPGAAEDLAVEQVSQQEGVRELELPDFEAAQEAAQVNATSIDLLRDVDLAVKIELGRCQMLVEDVLKLENGSVVELDKLAGDPVDVFVNERLVAHGEVLVLNDNFCVRINEIVSSVDQAEIV